MSRDETLLKTGHLNWCSGYLAPLALHEEHIGLMCSQRRGNCFLSFMYVSGPVSKWPEFQLPSEFLATFYVLPGGSNLIILKREGALPW